MFARSSIFGLFAASALSLQPYDVPSFRLAATGAVNLAVDRERKARQFAAPLEGAPQSQLQNRAAISARLQTEAESAMRKACGMCRARGIEVALVKHIKNERLSAPEERVRN